jgi:hypothetical protein
MTTHPLPPAIVELMRTRLRTISWITDAMVGSIEFIPEEVVERIVSALAPVWESAVSEQVDAAGLAGWLGGDNKIMSWLARHDQELRDAVRRETLDEPASSGAVAIDNIGTPREPAVVKGCEGYRCLCCDNQSTTKHLRLRWTYYPICDACWDIIFAALMTARKQPEETK